MQIITGLDTGGAETMLANLLSRLDPERCPSEVVSLTSVGDVGVRLREQGVRVRALGLRAALPGPRLLARLAGWIRASRPDAVQTWMYHADLVGGLAAARAGRVPVVWGMHNSSLDPHGSRLLTRGLVRVLAALSSRVPRRIVNVSRVSRDLHVRLGYPADKMVVIPNGFDLERYRPDAATRAVTRQALGFDAEARVVGLAARYDPQKDFGNFVAAAGRLADRRPDVRFLLCGAGVTWDNRVLAESIRASGLGERCHLLGLRDDVPALLAACDVVTSASAYGEAFPMAIGEAMSCAVPCVVTDVGDSAYLVGETGLVVPPRDVAALADAWERLLSAPASERAERGARARARIAAHFELGAIARRYEEVWRGVAEGGSETGSAGIR